MARRIRASRSPNRGIRERAQGSNDGKSPGGIVGPFMGTMQAGPARPIRAHGLADEHQDRGLLYVEKQIWDEALGEFEKAVNLSPDFSECWNNMGLCYLYTNRVEEAIDALNTAVRHFPGWHIAMANLGLAYQKAKQKDEALKYFLQAVNKNKNQPQVWCAIGEVYESKNDHELALGAYREAVSHAPRYDLALLRLGMLLARRTELDEAEGFLHKALAQNASYADAAGVLGAIAARKGLLEEARRSYEQAKQIRPERIPATAKRGLAALSTYDQGIEQNYNELKTAYDDLPSIAECMFNAGLVFTMNDKMSMARSSFQTAIDEDPQWPEPKIWLGFVEAMEKDPNEARRLWEEARQLDPENAMLSESIGLSALAQGLNQIADENFEAARELGRAHNYSSEAVRKMAEDN